MPKQQELIAEFRRERNVFTNGEPGTEEFRRTIIGTVRLNGDELTVKGEADEGKLSPGVTYRFFGHNRTHHKWGEQFHFSTFIAEEPATEAGIVAYLSQLTGPRIGVKRGIGKAVAYHLWEEYGPEAVAKLRESPLSVAGATPRLSAETAEAASYWLIQHQKIERTKIDLIGLLDGRGFSRKTIDRCIQRYGAKAAETIRHNPYLLMQFKGCGFKLTDKMYLDLGGEPARMKRQALCGWYALASDTNGHTWYSWSFVEKGIREGVGSAMAGVDKAIRLALRAGLVARYVDENEVEWLAGNRKAENERRLAWYVADSLKDEGDWSDVGGDSLTDHQAEQLSQATTRRIGCLAGSPGTGKTFAAARLIEAIIREHGREHVVVAAPTGKAAVRITEAMQAAGINLTARTIHSLLGVVSSDGGWHFEHHEGNPLPFRFIVVDESSMIDTDLMASLLAARGPDTHLLFVGDHRQLAPVGHGCPFLDFQRASVPTGELTEVRRNSGRIVTACAEIRDHHSFNVSEKLDVDAGENLICVPAYSSDAQIGLLERMYEKIQSANTHNPIWDLQVLVAVNRKSPLSRTTLNKHLQGLLNPTGKQVRGNPFRVGDKIINLKNGLFPAVNPSAGDDDGNVYVANGEQAEAIEVEPARTIAKLQAPERLIVIPHGQQQESNDDDDSENNSKGAAGSWDLAYAITAHKSQGSEWPIIVWLIDEHPGAKFLCTRNWIYTAISRAKKYCVLIGRKPTVDKMVRRDGLRRKTFLQESIRESRLQGVSVSEDEIEELFA